MDKLIKGYGRNEDEIPAKTVALAYISLHEHGKIDKAGIKDKQHEHEAPSYIVPGMYQKIYELKKEKPYEKAKAQLHEDIVIEKISVLKGKAEEKPVGLRRKSHELGRRILREHIFTHIEIAGHGKTRSAEIYPIQNYIDDKGLKDYDHVSECIKEPRPYIPVPL